MFNAYLVITISRKLFMIRFCLHLQLKHKQTHTRFWTFKG